MIQNVVYTLNQAGILDTQPKFKDLVVEL